MEQFSSAAELLKLVAHFNQLADALSFGSLSTANEAVYRAEHDRLKAILSLAKAA